ncbi:MAG: hypothetical protein KIT31_39945 [Deltaproteobacteria bacterium]|nr:hypothetical protein [Deltaproteobacteria bacterium]
MSATAGLVLAAAMMLSTTASAETIALPRTKVPLVLPDGWTRLEAAGVVAAARGPKHTLVAVTRAQVPNADAWMGPKTRAAYAAQVERGILRTLAPSRTKLGEANGVPALDVEARRPDGTLVLVRVLMFRTYALAVALEVPRDADAAEARAIAAAFTPPKA